MINLIVIAQIFLADTVNPPSNRAEILFSEGLYQDAVPHFEENLATVAKVKEKFRLRQQLAQCYMEIEDGEKAIALLESETQPEEYYLLGLAYQHTRNYSKAIAAFETYLKITPQLPQYSLAKLQLAITLYQSEKLNDAKNIFTSLHNQPLARLYLAKISLDNGYPLESERDLNLLLKDLKQEEPLRWEIFYLLGTIYIQQENYANAIAFFEKALPIKNPENAPWYLDTVLKLTQSHLKFANDLSISTADQLTAFNRAEAHLISLIDHHPCDEAYLAYGECLLYHGKQFHDDAVYKKGVDLLSDDKKLQTSDAKVRAIILRAETTDNFIERDRLYHELTDRMSDSRGWFLRGWNEIKEGERLFNERQHEESSRFFERATKTFNQGYLALKEIKPAEAAELLKYQAIAISRIDNMESLQAARNILDEFDDKNSFKESEEVDYLKGLIASKISQKENTNFVAAESIIQENLKRNPKGQYASASLLLLGTLAYKKSDFANAESLFLQITREFPNTPEAGESWYWAARTAEALEQPLEKIQNYKKHLFEEYPLCSYAAEAYLTFYPYPDYFEGSRTAIKHLQTMPSRFPDSKLIINAYYLIGLDAKKERRSEEGRLIKHQNLNSAIDAFQLAETAFDAQYLSKQIPLDELDTYVYLRYRAVFERALANLAIAEQSQGAKRQIYLEYAEDVFKSIIKDCQTTAHPLVESLFKSSPYPRVYQESEFWLAQTFFKENQKEKGIEIIEGMLEKYDSAKMTRSDYLSRSWFEKGQLAIDNHSYHDALRFYREAEEAGKGNILTTDQRLQIWIQNSHCYRAMEQYENAMTILSRAINDDSISSLRLKAMFLRAEIYELQGRKELAKKQLHAIAKKGGEWSIKAKEKLEKEYGYH